ncbi:hypothetical protein [Caballeronia sp. dw_19]|uniref:hypothetical protein n=1 Tax=Caballeronia sp. dw_19 TaxID=2719791 RepID=UPI001BD1510F|nr:hypothetical protein [Caballeronia sp. dw_19]
MAERRGWVSWSDEEKALVADVWARPEGLKKSVHLFNGRTIDGIKHMAHKLGLPPRSTGPANRGGPNEALVLQLLELRPMDITELAVKIGVSERAARFRVNDLHAAGRIHITRWERFSPHGAPSRMWALGPGEDAPRPKPIPRTTLQREWLKRMRREDPDKYERLLARKRLAERVRTGTIVRRDPAAAALFGPAEPRLSRRSRNQNGASPCA